MNELNYGICMCHRSLNIKPEPSIIKPIPEALYDGKEKEYLYPYTHAKLVYINEKLDGEEYATGKTVQEVLDSYLTRIEKLEQKETIEEKFRIKVIDNLVTNSGVQALSARQGMILKVEKEYTDCYKSDRWIENYIAYMQTHKCSKTPYYYFKDYEINFVERADWTAFFNFIDTLFKDGIDWIEIPWNTHEMLRIFDYHKDGYVFKFNRHGKLYRVYKDNPEKPWDDDIEGTIRIIDDCETEDPDSALSANQGFVLKEEITKRYTKEETDALVNAIAEDITPKIEEVNNVIGDFRLHFPTQSNTITSVLVKHEYDFDNLIARVSKLEQAINIIQNILHDIVTPKSH